MTGCIEIIVSFATREEAGRIARALLDRRLIACAHILPAGESFYWWQGKIDSATEHYAFFKTTADHFPAVEKEIKSTHSYEIPCILALPVAAGHAPFINWIREETKA